MRPYLEISFVAIYPYHYPKIMYLWGLINRKFNQDLLNNFILKSPIKKLFEQVACD